MTERLAITDRLEGFCCGIIAARLQPDDFFEQAAREHLLHAPIDFRVQGVARRIKAENQGAEAGEGGSPPLGLKFGQGPLLDEADLHGPNDFVGVLGGDTGGGSGVEPGEAAVQTAGLIRFDAGKSGAEDEVSGRPLKKAVEQRTEVKSRTAADDGQASAGGNLTKQRPRAAGKVAGREDFVGLQEVEQVVRNAAAFGDGQLGRADVEAPVELQRIKIYDFATEIQGQLDGKVALSGPGRAHQANKKKRRLNWRRYNL